MTLQNTKQFLIINSIDRETFECQLELNKFNMFRYLLNSKRNKILANDLTHSINFSYFIPYNFLLDSSFYPLKRKLKSLKIPLTLFSYIDINSIAESSIDMTFLKGRLKRLRMNKIKLVGYVGINDRFYKMLVSPLLSNNEIFLYAYAYYKMQKYAEI